MNINNKTLHDFGNDLRDALAPLEDKYGVTIRFGNISYTEERFTTKLTVTNGQNIEDVERSSFDADVWKFGHLGLERGMFNRIFLAPDGQKLAIRGFNTRSPKYPIIALRISDGQRLRCAPDLIAQLTDEYYQPNAHTDESTTVSTTASSAEVSTPQAEPIQPDLNSLIDEIARSEQETPFEKQNLNAQMAEKKKGESLQVGRKEIASLLSSCDVDAAEQKAFDEGYLEQFGAVGLDASLIADQKRFEIETENVKINVDPERSDLVEVKKVDGRRMITIWVEGDITVNGIEVDV